MRLYITDRAIVTLVYESHFVTHYAYQWGRLNTNDYPKLPSYNDSVQEFFLQEGTEEDRPWIKFYHQQMSENFRKIHLNPVVHDYLKRDLVMLEHTVNRVLGLSRIISTDVIYKPSYAFWWFYNRIIRNFVDATCIEDIGDMKTSVFTDMNKFLDVSYLRNLN